MNLSNFAATFLQEAEELLRQIEAAALELEARPHDADLVNQLFRAFHTIKGSGAMFGFGAVASFTHHVETTLDHVREGRLAVSPALVSLVLAAKDHIQGLLALDPAGDASSLAAGSQLSARFEALSGHLRSSLSAPAAASTPASTPAAALVNEAAAPGPGPSEHYRVSFQLDPSALGLGIDPGCLLRELGELGPCRFHAGVERP